MAEVVSTMVQVHVTRELEGGWEHLLLRRSSSDKTLPGVWQVVTGNIKPNESAVDAALRELREETGLTTSKAWVLPFVSSFYSTSLDAICTLPVFGVVAQDPDELRLSEEHDDFKWLCAKECCEQLVLPAQVQGVQVFESLLSIPAGRDFHRVYNLNL